MADGSAGKTPSLKGVVDEAEWRARVDLAALYRLVALQGWDDMIFTHISARVPGPEHHFLINPYGMFFGEMTASSLVKVDLDGFVVQETDYAVNPAGFTIHSAIHMARPDASFVMHLHTDAGVSVSAHEEGLMPISQHALIALPNVSYHDYEGIALELDERKRLVSDLGPAKKLMILRNHGTLALGATAAECWMGMYYLEKACVQQIMTLSAGRQNIRLAPEAARAEVAAQISTPAMGLISRLAWPGSLRDLARRSPGYDV